MQYQGLIDRKLLKFACFGILVRSWWLEELIGEGWVWRRAKSRLNSLKNRDETEGNFTRAPQSSFQVWAPRLDPMTSSGIVFRGRKTTTASGYNNGTTAKQTIRVDPNIFYTTVGFEARRVGGEELYSGQYDSLPRIGVWECQQFYDHYEVIIHQLMSW